MTHLTRYQAALRLSPGDLGALAAMQREDGQEALTVAAYLDWLAGRASEEVRAYGEAWRSGRGKPGTWRTEMLSKDLFIEMMTEFHAIEQDIDTVDEAMKTLSSDFGGFGHDRPMHLILRLLEAVMEDEGEWIQYYAYERNWGERETFGIALGPVTVNDVEYQMESLDDLYAVLVACRVMQTTDLED